MQIFPHKADEIFGVVLSPSPFTSSSARQLLILPVLDLHLYLSPFLQPRLVPVLSRLFLHFPPSGPQTFNPTLQYKDRSIESPVVHLEDYQTHTEPALSLLDSSIKFDKVTQQKQLGLMLSAATRTRERTLGDGDELPFGDFCFS